MTKEQANCKELSQKILETMRNDGYSYRAVDRGLVYIYRRLMKFCDENCEGVYSRKAGEIFLEENNKRGLSKGHFNAYVNAVHRMDCALIGDFHWRAPNKATMPYAASCLDKILPIYEEHLYDTGKTRNDIRSRMHVLSRFLKYAGDHGCSSLSDINAPIIYGGFEAEGSKGEFRKSIGHFIRYAFRQGIIESDMSSCIPEVSRHKPVPTVYSNEEINTILDSIDKGSKTGRRDFAIIVVAARTGMRSCDIASLTFENIDRAGRSIAITQKKTGEPIAFPLLEEIRTAIDDYVENERPDSVSPYVFLKTDNPDHGKLLPHTIYTIVSRRIKASGIETNGRKMGAHALRSSLASQLLEEGNSYSTIQKVLGHTSPETAKHYVRVETERLRGCALGMPEFSPETESFVLKGEAL